MSTTLRSVESKEGLKKKKDKEEIRSENMERAGHKGTEKTRRVPGWKRGPDGNEEPINTCMYVHILVFIF